jgi:hypothetical protein
LNQTAERQIDERPDQAHTSRSRGAGSYPATRQARRSNREPSF